MAIFDKDKKKKQEPMFSLPPMAMAPTPVAGPQLPKPEEQQLDEDSQMFDTRKQLAEKEKELKALMPTGKEGQEFYEQLARDARKAYKDERSTLQWLEVADTIAQALTQFGAAKSGVTGVRPSKADLRSQFAALREDYQDEVANIGKRSSKLQSTVSDMLRLQRDYAAAKARRDERKAAAETRAEERAADKAFQAEQAQLGREHQMKMAELRATQQKERDTRKVEEKQKREEAKPPKRDIQREQQLKKATELLGKVQASDKKKRISMEEASATLRIAGVDEALIEEYKKEKDKWFGDEDEVLKKIEDQLVDLGARPQGTSVATKQPAPETKPSAKKDSKVADWAEQNGMDYEQALQILTSRGYKPSGE